MKEIFSRLAHGCAIFCVGLSIMWGYCLAIGLDEKTMKMGGLLVVIMTWALEQHQTNKS
jgi:hypothetical protein